MNSSGYGIHQQRWWDSESHAVPHNQFVNQPRLKCLGWLIENQKTNFNANCICRIELLVLVIEVNAAPGVAGFVLLQDVLGVPQFG